MGIDNPSPPVTASFLNRLKFLLVGRPLSTEELHHERIPKWKALAVLSSDALSSVAYATEEVLIPLSLFAAPGNPRQDPPSPCPEYGKPT